MEQLKAFIRVVPDFPKPGISFKDVSPLLARPAALKSVIAAFAENWSEKVDAIAALDARGFIFGSALALALDVPFVMIRKKGKLPGPTHEVSYGLEYGSDIIEVARDAFRPQARVLVVDDLLATGGTASAACSLVEQAGAIVAGLAFVVELSDLGGRKKLEGHLIDSLIVY